MELVNASNVCNKSRCVPFDDATISLTPCDASIKILTTLCLYEKKVAPMTVDERSVKDFVATIWKCLVVVAKFTEDSKNINCFKFGFEHDEDRVWALENGPWLRHQRCGCTLSSPDTVLNNLGIPFPIFGPWLFASSPYVDVFSSEKIVPSQDFSSKVSVAKPKLISSSPVTVECVFGTVNLRVPFSKPLCASRQTLTTTAGLRTSPRTGCLTVWMAKNSFSMRETPIVVSGNGVGFSNLEGEKPSNELPNLEKTILSLEENDSEILNPCDDMAFANGTGRGLFVVGPGPSRGGHYVVGKDFIGLKALDILDGFKTSSSFGQEVNFQLDEGGDIRAKATSNLNKRKLHLLRKGRKEKSRDAKTAIEVCSDNESISASPMSVLLNGRCEQVGTLVEEHGLHPTQEP
uniref:DUF4283 domain-containing protein n=1 Tax=Cannabis sativa TaxID=3483 RepID=A0A803Q292_CANSA